MAMPIHFIGGKCHMINCKAVWTDLTSYCGCISYELLLIPLGVGTHTRKHMHTHKHTHTHTHMYAHLTSWTTAISRNPV